MPITFSGYLIFQYGDSHTGCKCIQTKPQKKTQISKLHWKTTIVIFFFSKKFPSTFFKNCTQHSQLTVGLLVHFLHIIYYLAPCTLFYDACALFSSDQGDI